MDRLKLRTGDLRDRVEILRGAPAVNDRGRRTTSGRTVVATRWCAFVDERYALTAAPAGQQVTGSLLVALLQPLAVQPGDVLRVLTGPRAGSTWTAQPPTYPDSTWLVVPVEPSKEELSA